MRTLAAFAALTLAACLIAPDKPSARGDAGGTGGDGGGDGGGSSIGPFGSGCLSPSDSADVAITFDLAGSGNDSLFRGGIQGGVPKIWRFDPPVTNSACPSHTYEVTSVANARTIDALSISPHANSFGSATVLFAAVGTGLHETVLAWELDAAGAVTVPQQLETSVIPQPVEYVNGFEHPAFIQLVDADHQLWVGGGSSLGVLTIAGSQLPSFAGSVSFGSGSGSGNGSAQLDAYYDVAETTGSAHTALVGAASTYVLVAESGGASSAVYETVADTSTYGTCAANHPCDPLVSAHPHPGAASIELAIVSLDSRNGKYNTVSSTGLPQAHSVGTSLPAPPFLMASAVVDALTTDGDDFGDLATLWVDTSHVQPPRLFLYSNIQATQATSFGPENDLGTALRDVTCVAALRRGALHSLVLLSSHPGESLTGEACVFTDGSGDLRPCP